MSFIGTFYRKNLRQKKIGICSGWIRNQNEADPKHCEIPLEMYEDPVDLLCDVILIAYFLI